MSTYDTTVGQLFHGFVSPYSGAFGVGASANAFWPAPGDNDWLRNGLQDYKQFFASLLDNQRYYDVCFGDLHLFVLDTSASEPDGNTITSIQANWLRAKLFLSTAPWKVVMMFDAPYSSTAANSALIWPFANWGANLVISGKPRNYERFNISGLVVINNGLGGNPPIDTFSSQATGSQFQYAAGFGVGRMTVSATSLKYDFLDTSGNLIDTVTLTK